MLSGVWTIVELRGPSVVSFILIIVLFKFFINQKHQITTLNKKIDNAKDDINKKIYDILERYNEGMTELKTNVGKQTESIKSICVTLDNVQKDIRQIREIKN